MFTTNLDQSVNWISFSKKRRPVGFLFFILSVLAVVPACNHEDADPSVPISFQNPSHFPDPVYKMDHNKVTQSGFELGRALFYETKLSKDNSISCGSCHQQSSAFTHHGHSVSHGIHDKIGTRNSPPVMNLAWSNAFMWDGGVFDLDFFSIAPITNPIEMGEEVKDVVEKLKKDPVYPPRFQKAFGSSEITSTKMFLALSQFMVMCISADSKYDQWKLVKGAVLSEEEQDGLRLVTEKCGGCHSGELFTDNKFHNNGIGQGRLVADEGRQKITLSPLDNRKFKTPSLRNLKYTAPYMHDGRFFDLNAVMTHYTSQVKESATLDSLLRTPSGTTGIELTPVEVDHILLFLNTLNDENFIRNYELSEFAVKK